MSIDVSAFAGGGQREDPQKPPAREKLDLKPSQVRCTYCLTWADMEAVKKQKFKCLNCGGPFDLQTPTSFRPEPPADEDFGAMMRRRLEEREGRRVRMF